VYVVESHAHRLDLPGIEILALPFGGENANFELRPRDRRNISVLVAHGLENSMNLPGATLSLARMNYPEWDYIALGDFHIRKRLADNVWYSGSTDYTSSNFWEEGLEKGWNLFDSETGEVTFVRVEPVRAPVPLPDIDAADLTGVEIGDMLLRNAHWDANALPMVRQVVRNCMPASRNEIPQEVKAELQSRAFHYQLDIYLRARENQPDHVDRGASLEDEWTNFAENRVLPSGIERKEFVEGGHRLLKEAGSDSS
jgi:DNA repair exonuclease SbcCD nuclease subunit